MSNKKVIAIIVAVPVGIAILLYFILDSWFGILLTPLFVFGPPLATLVLGVLLSGATLYSIYLGFGWLIRGILVGFPPATLMGVLSGIGQIIGFIFGLLLAGGIMLGFIELITFAFK